MELRAGRGNFWLEKISYSGSRPNSFLPNPNPTRAPPTFVQSPLDPDLLQLLPGPEPGPVRLPANPERALLPASPAEETLFSGVVPANPALPPPSDGTFEPVPPPDQISPPGFVSEFAPAQPDYTHTHIRTQTYIENPPVASVPPPLSVGQSIPSVGEIITTGIQS